MGVWKKAAAFALAGAVAVSMGGCGRKAPEEDEIQVTEAVRRSFRLSRRIRRVFRI